MAPRTLFLIPARSGSLGLPGKNLMEVGHGSLLARSVKRALRCLVRLGGNGRVVVSTDCQAYARAAEQAGAEVPWLRPEELAGDEAKTIDVVRHALEAEGDDFSEVCVMQCTSPLTHVDDMLDAILRYRQDPAVPLVSVVRAKHASNWHFREVDGILAGEADIVGRRQELQPEYMLTGAFYLANPEWLRTQSHWVKPGTTRMVEIATERSLDIDDLCDLEAARLAWRRARPWEATNRVMIIAEAGVNHNGCLERAMEMVKAARQSGADAIKFQMFNPDKLAIGAAPLAKYQEGRVAGADDMRSMLEKLVIGPDEMARLATATRAAGLLFCASPFDLESVEALDRLRPDFIKIASGEITNFPLLQAIGSLCRPVILSTGMSTLSEVSDAVDCLKAAGADSLAVLQCTSNYPTDPRDVNLRAMHTLASSLNLPVGFSDHTVTTEIGCAAVAMGACVLEKHFTLDRSLPGPDHSASADVVGLERYIVAVRNVEAALGSSRKEPVPSEMQTAAVARKSLVAACRIPAGTPLTADMLCVKRPGTGLPPRRLDDLLGCVPKCDIEPDTLITFELFR